MMKSAKLHVISFNIPLPADYGGVIGVYFHLKALHKLGVRIILHCFEYGREKDERLNEVCEAVFYYKRDMGLSNLISTEPFIVKSRRNDELLNRLLEDDLPILYEGTHVCATLDDKRLKNRLKIVRMHNVEWQYYRNMIPIEKSLKQKIFFWWESKKLKPFETKRIKEYADHILAVSPRETRYFKENGFENVHYVAAFHSNEDLDCKLGRGDYVLFQGDLSVKENESISLGLIQDIFVDLPGVNLIIAGRQPSKDLRDEIDKHENVSLRSNLTDEEMEALIRNAQINLLRAYQAAGMKLKLLNALYKGRFCLVNSPMVMNTGIDELCIVKDGIGETKSEILRLMGVDFPEEEIIKRRKLFDEKGFSNIAKAKITLSIINEYQNGN